MPGMVPSVISGWPNFGGIRRDDDVAHHRKLAAAAERVTADCRNRRLAAARDTIASNSGKISGETSR